MGFVIHFADFATALAVTSTADQAVSLLMRVLKDLGFCSWDYGFGTAKVPRPRTALDLEFLYFHSNLDWENRYLDYGYVTVDRSTPRNLAGVSPHLYGDVLWKNPQNALQAQMEDDIHAKSINSGLSIPMHMSGNRIGVLNLGSSMSVEEFRKLDLEIRPNITLIAQIFHDHMTQRFWPAESPLPLSTRERECLHWAAQGKTAWEIGEILSLAERTVKKHIASAMKRLEATTRTQAVAKAAAKGLIVP